MKWYCTTRGDTPASAAISRTVAIWRPRSAAIRQTASAIWRRRPAGSGAAGAGTGGFLRDRYARAWQAREQ
ncbi:hypothetical protein Pmi06nite_79330 [Planotetraspora mira]|uniref:Uncharacterized protein n=1 Tax=Planotetraspora mira TaxID=58121 RepID=A0A8J3XBE3_9ACTN|nr:hypothetical protein Pmi06nite_79330 [Planotetraspora mira]